MFGMDAELVTYIYGVGLVILWFGEGFGARDWNRCEHRRVFAQVGKRGRNDDKCVLMRSRESIERRRSDVFERMQGKALELLLLALRSRVDDDRSGVASRFDDMHALLYVAMNNVGNLCGGASLYEAGDVTTEVISKQHVLVVAVLPFNGRLVVTDLEELIDARGKQRAGKRGCVVDPGSVVEGARDHVRCQRACWVQRAAGKFGGPELGDEQRLQRCEAKSVVMKQVQFDPAETHEANCKTETT